MSSSTSPAPAPSRRTRLGILGGGQLARMLALAAHPLGVDCVVVEPAPDPPAGPVAQVIAAAYDDPAALAVLATCDVVTVELEGVPPAALAWLAERVPVRPNPDAITTSADRLLEKRLLRRLGIATAPFDDEVTGAPAIVKSRRGGFDGRGNRLARTDDALAAARAELPDPIVEGIVRFERELSIVAARGVDGETRCWPLVENQHEHGILRRTLAPAPFGDDTARRALGEQAVDLAHRVLEALDYVGVLAIELFEHDGRLVANELAPRVHNSGHWSMDGAVTGQFEQHVRAVCGLPLGDPSALGVTAMLNAVGGLPDRSTVLAVPGTHLHVYGKSARPGRKLGHVNVTAPDDAELACRLAALTDAVPFVV